MVVGMRNLLSGMVFLFSILSVTFGFKISFVWAAGNCVLPLQEPPPKFDKGPSGKKAFIDWLTPAAQYVESKTGLPGAQIIAQAGLETGWGTSNVFNKAKGIFGHSCFNGRTQTGVTKLGDTSVNWKGECAMNRPAAEGGKYLVFNTYAESIAAYVQNLLEKGPYKELRSIVARASPPSRPADPTETIKATAKAGYAADGSYADKLLSIVRTNKFQTPMQASQQTPASGGAGNVCKADPAKPGEQARPSEPGKTPPGGPKTETPVAAVPRPAPAASTTTGTDRPNGTTNNTGGGTTANNFPVFGGGSQPTNSPNSVAGSGSGTFPSNWNLPIPSYLPGEKRGPDATIRYAPPMKKKPPVAKNSNKKEVKDSKKQVSKNLSQSNSGRSVAANSAPQTAPNVKTLR